MVVLVKMMAEGSTWQVAESCTASLLALEAGRHAADEAVQVDTAAGLDVEVEAVDVCTAGLEADELEADVAGDDTSYTAG